VMRDEREADEANMLALCALFKCVTGLLLVSLYGTQNEGSLSSWRALCSLG
jgi:hypothetical protein